MNKIGKVLFLIKLTETEGQVNTQMGKILLLGGSQQQIVAIQTAKKLGYETVLCDYLPDNPGQKYADRFYLVSTTDKDAVLRVAGEEQVDGILAYASDPAAPTAAYVAEQLGLPGNPYESVEILCNKDQFRRFLQENGFSAPKSAGYSSVEAVQETISRFTLPVIVKPVDSSGSKGATVLYDLEGLTEAVRFAFSFSRCHRVIVEEFIEKKHRYLIGGDIFVEDGKVILWGLMNCHRDACVNTLVPVGKSYPLELDAADEANVKATLQRMIDVLQLRSCAMNVELVVDQAGRVFPIDVGPRSGGNMIPDLMSMIFGVDVVEMSIRAAMGEKIEAPNPNGEKWYATHNLHSSRKGIYQDITFDAELEKHIVRKCLYKLPGDTVEFFDNASKVLGIIFLHFGSEAEMHEVLAGIETKYHVILT